MTYFPYLCRDIQFLISNPYLHKDLYKKNMNIDNYVDFLLIKADTMYDTRYSLI